MAPAQKMQGFGSDDLGLTGPGSSSGSTQHADIHNKPPPKSLWHAASRFASTTWDTVKSGEDSSKKGHTGGDVKKAAGDALLVLTGVCKFKGAVNFVVEERMCCPCAGCQSWDNERSLRTNKEAEDRDQRQIERDRAAAKSEKEAQEEARNLKLNPIPAYAPPRLDVPASSSSSEPQSQRRGPWGPANDERRDERSSGSGDQAVKPDPAPYVAPAPEVDLLGGGEPASPFAFVDSGPTPAPVESADLLGGEPAVVPTVDVLDLLEVPQESRDLTNLLMSHAAEDDEEEGDLLGMGTADAKPTEQLDGLLTADAKPTEQLDGLF